MKHLKGTPIALFFAGLAALVVNGMVTSCNFDATNPAAVTEDELLDDPSLTAMVNGSIAQYNFGQNMAAFYTGTLAQELIGSGTWESLHMASNDGAILNEGLRPGELPQAIWNPLSVGRAIANEAYDLLKEFGGDDDPRLARSQIYHGMFYSALGSVFCQATYDGGPAVPQSESYEEAEILLTDGLQRALASDQHELANLGYLMRARNRLYAADLDGALADAKQVPDGFEVTMSHTVEDFQAFTHDFWRLTIEIPLATVHPKYREIDDPRVVVVETSRVGQDGRTPVWEHRKFNERNIEIPIGRWQEARLIEAEILIERNQVSEAVNLMNRVRAVWDLEPFDSDLAQDQARDLMRQERKHEFWLEGAIRMIDRARWGSYPEGWSDCLPIPIQEVRSNPNL